MTISAKVIAHSSAEGCPDLITLVARYPRMIHAEFMTHRVFSRNASSSRAIPVERMIQDVLDDPAMPVAWGSNKPGMQAGEECMNLVRVYSGGEACNSREDAWLEARDRAVEVAQGFADAGYHKQIVNRLLEPFAHITVIVTATEWDNFFALRCHPAADPTMRALAEAMRDEISKSCSVPHWNSQWHLPFVTDDDRAALLDEPNRVKMLRNISAARCARVSYLNHDGTKPDIAKDLALAERLWIDQHLSPFEHQAKPNSFARNYYGGNLDGWQQNRKLMESDL